MKGPVPDKVSVKPAACKAAVNVLKESFAAAIATTLLPLPVVAPSEDGVDGVEVEGLASGVGVVEGVVGADGVTSGPNSVEGVVGVDGVASGVGAVVPRL